MTQVITAAELGRTYFCHTPGCAGEATGPRGVAAYCRPCRELRKRRRERGEPEAGDHHMGVKDAQAALGDATRTLDRCRAQASLAVRRFRDAQVALDQARYDLAQATRRSVREDG